MAKIYSRALLTVEFSSPMTHVTSLSLKIKDVELSIVLLFEC